MCVFCAARSASGSDGGGGGGTGDAAVFASPPVAPFWVVVGLWPAVFSFSAAAASPDAAIAPSSFHRLATSFLPAPTAAPIDAHVSPPCFMDRIRASCDSVHVAVDGPLVWVPSDLSLIEASSVVCAAASSVVAPPPPVAAVAPSGSV